MKPCFEVMDRFLLYLMGKTALCGVSAWLSAAAFLLNWKVLFSRSKNQRGYQPPLFYLEPSFRYSTGVI